MTTTIKLHATNLEALKQEIKERVDKILRDTKLWEDTQDMTIQSINVQFSVTFLMEIDLEKGFDEK